MFVLHHQVVCVCVEFLGMMPGMDHHPYRMKPVFLDSHAASEDGGGAVTSAVHGDLCVAYCKIGFVGASEQLQCVAWPSKAEKPFTRNMCKHVQN